MKHRSVLASVLLLGAATALADDHGNSRSRATPIAPTSTTQGILERGDADYFRVELPAAGALVLSSSGGVDTVGRLEGPNGTRIATDNNGGDGRNFRIARDLDPGAYYLLVRGRRGATGAYGLTATFAPADDHGDSRQAATPVTMPSSTAGRLERSGDVDYFRIDIGIGQTGFLVVASTGDTDTTGRLERSDGREVATDDDGGDVDNFRIETYVGFGTYYVLVGGYDDAHTGEYTLEVSLRQEGDLRLVDGSGKNAGRLEILYDGEWGTVCDDQFSDVDAAVACRQLGYAYGIAGQSPISGANSIWLDDVACTGKETRLDQCGHAGFGVHNCQHFEDVAVACSDEGIVRLSISDAARISEGQAAVFTLTRSSDDAQLLSASLTVPVHVSENGDMLASPRPNSVTFEAGSTNATLRLATDDDATIEADSTVSVGVGSKVAVVEGEGHEIGFYFVLGQVVVADNDRPTGDDHGDSRSEATSVSKTSSTAGLLENIRDVDYFRIDIEQSGRLIVASVGGTDTIGFLEQGDGTELATDNNGGAGRNFRIGYDVAAGTHYVAVHGGTHNTVGEYILEVSFTPAPNPPQEGDLRLVDGSRTSGRLEILHSGEWGTVCDDDFRDVDADVACRQLGHVSGEALSHSFDRPQGTGEIWLDNVACSGDEIRLDQCAHRGFGVHNCHHLEDIWISCGDEEEEEEDEEEEEVVRVAISADGARVSEGQTAGFTLTRSNSATATSNALTVRVRVVETGNMLSSRPDSVTFGAESPSATLLLTTDDDAVFEADSTVTVIVVDGDGYSPGRPSAATIVVADNDHPVDDHGDSRSEATSVSKPSSTAGVLGNIHDVDYFRIHIEQAGRLVATSVGFTDTTGVLEQFDGTELATDDDGGIRRNFRIVYDVAAGIYYIAVRGIDHDAFSEYALEVSFTPAPPGPPQEGDLRLVDGSATRGRLEILHSGEWGTVCDDDFRDVDADVACRQLGHISGRALSHSFDRPQVTGEIWLDNVACTGDEIRLDQCAHPGFGVHNCHHLEDIWVSCVAAESDSTPTPEPDPTPALAPPINVVTDRVSDTKLRLNWDSPAGGTTFVYDVCIQAGTADCVPATRQYARPYQRRGDESWTFHLFGNPSGGTDGLTPGTTYRMCVLARRGEDFSPTVCVTGATTDG